MIKQLQNRLAERELELEVKPLARAAIIDQGYDPIYGARPLRRAVMRLLEDNLAEQCLSQTLYPRTKLIVDADMLENITVEIDYRAIDPDIRRKMREEEKKIKEKLEKEKLEKDDK